MEIAAGADALERGYQRKTILDLFHFIDWVLSLPAGLDQRFQEQLAEYEATMSRPYITTVERHGIKKGLQLGRAEGHAEGLADQRALLVRLTSKRFGTLHAETLAPFLEPITDTKVLADIGEWLFDCASGDELIDRVRGLGGNH